MTTRRKKPLHEKRKISFAEYGALLGTREMLANGELDHNATEPNTHVFDMGKIHMDNGTCGAVSCIGGTMALIMGLNPEIYTPTVGGGLEKLFYPPDEYEWGTITSKQAIQAIDNFLRTGKPCWRRILRKDQRGFW